MGDWFLLGLIVCFVIYELVMHFVFKNEGGNETLSNIVRRLEAKRWWIRLITTLVLVVLFLHLVLVLFVVSADAQTGPVLPPVRGQTYRAVTPVTVPETVCTVGWTASIRPPTGYTSALKKWLLRDRALPGTVADYQLDHLVSLELGGAPYSTDNLWMQPQSQAHRDDALENGWHKKLCSGQLTLKQARQAELSWKRIQG